VSKRVYYGWYIVGASLLAGCLLFGIRLTYGVFFKSLEGEFLLGRAATSGVYSVYMIVAAVTGIVAGMAVDRWGPRRTLVVMALITGLSLVLVAQTEAFWQLYVTYGFLMAVGSGGAYAVLLSATSRWFVRNRGLALSLAGSGAAVGAIVMAPFAAYLIEQVGWRMSYLIMGIVAMLGVSGLSFVFKKEPESLGPEADVVTTPRLQTVSRDAGSAMGRTLGEALHMRNFWLISSIWLFFSLSSMMLLTHAVPYMTDMRMSTTLAAGAISFAGVAHIISRLGTGFLTDRFGRKLPGVIAGLVQATALVGFVLARDPVMFYVSAGIWGLAWGAVSIACTALIVDSFGTRNIGLIMGTLDVAFAAGSALGPWIGGLIFDYSGSYFVAFTMAAMAGILEALLMGFTSVKNGR